MVDPQNGTGTNYSISTLKVYEQMGKITYSSNATRGSGNSTNGWTRSTSDNAGRIVEVATFSGDAQPSASPANTITGWTGSVNMTYDAEFTTVTDQAGKIRRSTRLTHWAGWCGLTNLTAVIISAPPPQRPI